MIKVKFMRWECDVEKSKYSVDNSIALELTHPEDGLIATATVCLPENGKLPEDYTWIKTWSENKGIVEALVEAGIVETTGIEFPVNEFGSVAVIVKVLI